jgi:hypothetical protein
MGQVSRLLAERVSLRVSCLDRLLVGGYVPKLQSEGLLVRWMLDRKEAPSPRVLGRAHDRMVDGIDRFVAESGVPLVSFRHGVRKEDVARPYQLAAAGEHREGVVLVGVAPEKLVGGWRGRRDGGNDEHPHFAFTRAQMYVNHYYFYVWDSQWGPAFVKMCPIAPFPVWACLNGHEWLKCRLADTGVGFKALDNGLLSCEDEPAAQGWADRLSGNCVREFMGRWLARLPGPFQARDCDLGYCWEYSFRQAEFSDTAIFERPRDGRAWFDAAIREHLDVGHPEKVALVFDRRVTSRTPGAFSTKVVTPGVDPHIQIHYRSSKTKAYFKDLHGVRVETTINNPADFGVRKTVNAENFDQLRQIGCATNSRFLEAVGENSPPPPDTTALEEVVMPSLHDGLNAPGFRFGEPRARALLASIVAFTHVVGGLTNAGLCRTMRSLHDPAYSTRQATYDLRRLRRKGFIKRVPGRNHYLLTPHGRAMATTMTKLYARVVVPALSGLEADLAPPGSHRRPIVTAWRAYENQLDKLIAASGIAA